ncbi:uncharacterized protein IUM83_10515 [Phytophthora cinnamomi]|uniref:uncharacterized protein n=1 Tax=Phytophthora cinnamomi TaxID=4785 RepID=UPI0035598B97|nr:hypothetical protein IUM83_10515 [Phytophthora cinnamomi]
MLPMRDVTCATNASPRAATARRRLGRKARVTRNGPTVLTSNWRIMSSLVVTSRPPPMAMPLLLMSRSSATPSSAFAAARMDCSSPVSSVTIFQGWRHRSSSAASTLRAVATTFQPCLT